MPLPPESVECYLGSGGDEKHVNNVFQFSCNGFLAQHCHHARQETLPWLLRQTPWRQLFMPLGTGNKCNNTCFDILIVVLLVPHHVDNNVQGVMQNNDTKGQRTLNTPIAIPNKHSKCELRRNEVKEQYLQGPSLHKTTLVQCCTGCGSWDSCTTLSSRTRRHLLPKMKTDANKHSMWMQCTVFTMTSPGPSEPTF